MFTIHHVLVFISYLCARNVQCWAIITKSDMGIQRYNRLKAAIKREQNEVHFNSAEREQARRFSSTVRRGKSTLFKIVLAEKELVRGSQSRLDTASVPFHDGRPTRCSHLWNNSTRLHDTSTWM